MHQTAHGVGSSRWISRPSRQLAIPSRVRGFVLWSGPSRLTGDPVVAIALLKSSNRKTGSLMQTLILRADMPPVEAARGGFDDAICGSCPLRPRNAARVGDLPVGSLRGRGCYVNLGAAPTTVFHAWRRGVYRPTDDLAALGAGRLIRLGTYGDPAAVPDRVWRKLLKDSRGHTGYTHQPGLVPHMRDYLMASAGSPEDARRLRALGWRTFEIRPKETPVRPGTILCPAESHGARCEDCLLCDGAPDHRHGVKSVTITAHGSGARFAA